MIRHKPGTLGGFPDPPATDSARAEPELRPRDRSRAVHPLIDKFGRWLAAKGWIHVLLITMVAGCLYPLVWMFLTSIKTDEELGDSDLAPSFPTFRPQSPYVRDAGLPHRPDDVEPARFEAALPALVAEAQAVVTASLPDAGSPPPSVDRARWIESAATVLVNRAIAQLPKQAWSESPEALGTRLRALLTPEMARQTLSDQLCRLELSALTLRTLDGRLFTLTGRGDFSGWRVETPNAALVAAGGASLLQYRFASSSDAPVVLSYEFGLPAGVEAADIHKLFLSIRPDDSWHGLTATLDVAGTHWKSTRTTYLAQNRPQSISFQPPTFDDTTIRARTWGPLRGDGPSARSRNARLELRLAPS